MNKFFIIILFVFLSTLQIVPIIFAQETSQTVRISKIKIKGLNRNIDIERLKLSMTTDFPSWKFWTEKPEFVDVIFKDDIERIKDFLGDYGYYNADVRYQLKYDVNNNVEIYIDIDQGDPVILKKLYINLAKDYPREIIPKLYDSISLTVDKRFSVIRFQNSKEKIIKYFADIGYPKAELESEAKVNKRENWAEVSISVDPGFKYKFGKIQFEGLSNIELYLVERELTYKEGETFSLSKLTETQSKIFRLGFFKSVIFDTQFDDKKLIVDTIFTVVERKLGTISVGAGFGAEDRLRGQILINRRNFFGGGRSLEISSKFSFITQFVQTKLVQPHFLDSKGTEASILLNLERDDFPSFRGNSIKTNFTISRELTNYITAFSSLGINYSKIEAQAERTSIQESQDNIFLTLIDSGIKYNSTDNLINPTKGFFTSLLFETSVKEFGSDVNYFKTLLEIKGYKKVSKFILAKRFQIGFIEPFGSSNEFDVPIFKRLFAGGSTSMRGFPFQKLGPLDNSEDPIGGNSSLIGNMELRFPLFKELGGVLFFDYGNVYEQSFYYDLTDIRYAIGTGLRYETIVGPIRVDVGYALNPNEELRRVQVFLSIGQTF